MTATPSFIDLMQELTQTIGDREPDGTLQEWLNAELGPGTDLFQRIQTACEQAVADGWMCNREAGGIAFGRVIKPNTDLGAYSVDVVRMENIDGPHHRHPNGEIDMIMPLSGEPQFDGHGPGWKVYEPGSAHVPSVHGGAALVLYLLPEGAIEFT